MSEAIFTDVSGKVRLIGSLTGATPAADAPQWATRTLTAAEIKSLSQAAIEIVPAPGAGKVLLPLPPSWLHYRPGAVPFGGDGSPLALGYSTLGAAGFSPLAMWGVTAVAGAGFTSFDFLTAPGPMIGFFQSLGSSYFVAADIEDSPLSFGTTSPFDLEDGDGTLTVSVLYTILVSAALS